MSVTRFVAGIIAAGLTVFTAGVACGQDFPNKPIRIFTSAAGGTNDILSRQIGQGISGPLGQPVIVENRGIGGIDIVAKAPPDGYAVLLYGPPFWLSPLMRKVSYDPVRDFSPITLLVRVPNILVAHPSLPVKSVKELIALAKARPGELDYAAGNPGSGSHLGMELFKAMAGVDIVGIPYKCGGAALIALIGGHVQLTIDGFALMPHIKSGKLRALAVTTARPTSLYPELPTVAASLPGYEAVTLNGTFAPAKTPAAIINRLNMEIVRYLNRSEVKEQFSNTGVEVVGSSPEQLAAAITSEMTSMGKVIRDAGIRAD